MVRVPHRKWVKSLVVLALGLFALIPASALAQSELDEAEGLFEEANFEGALEILESVDQGSGLDRAGVVRAYLLRALVFHALSDQEALDRALRELAIIAPDYAMDVSFPPAVRGRFEVIRSRDTEPLSLTVETSAVSGGYEIAVRVEGDTEGVIRGITIFTRIAGGDWLQNDGNTARIPVARGSVLDFYVQANGPGGAVLLVEGSQEEPHDLGEADTSANITESLETETNGNEREISPWVWVGSGAAVVVVTAVVLGVVLGTRQPDNTRVGPLEIDWP